MSMKILERLGLLKPRYRDGWPRGVRPMFPSMGPIKAHILAHDPSLWAAMCMTGVLEGLTMAQDAGLLEGVEASASMGSIRLVQPQ